MIVNSQVINQIGFQSVGFVAGLKFAYISVFADVSSTMLVEVSALSVRLITEITLVRLFT